LSLDLATITVASCRDLCDADQRVLVDIEPEEKRERSPIAAQNEARMKTPANKLTHVAATVLLLSGCAGGWWYRGELVQWLKASEQTPSILVSGNIEAHQSVLGFKTVQSRIVELPFNEGQWVKAGTLISRLDDSDYRQQVRIGEAALEVQRRQLGAAEQNLAAAKKTVEADEADLELARVEFSRADDLMKKGAGTIEARDQTNATLKRSNAALERDQALEKSAERQVELAQANVHNAKEALKLAQIVLDYTILNAPFEGVITVRQAELGEIMVPGTPVVTLADLDHIWMRGYINETDIGKVRLDQAAAVKTDTYPGKTYKGRVSFISSAAEFTPKSVETHAERVTLVYRIKIDIDNPTHELVPGMPVDALLDALPAGVP
jgi:HlyD family secretion protein